MTSARRFFANLYRSNNIYVADAHQRLPVRRQRPNPDVSSMPCHVDWCARAGASALNVRTRRRRRAFRDARATEAAVEQQLDDQAAERVTDQYRRLVEPLEQRCVVVDGLGEGRDRPASLSPRATPRRRRASRPLGQGNGEALPKQSGDALPATWKATRGESASTGSARRSYVRRPWSTPFLGTSATQGRRGGARKVRSARRSGPMRLNRPAARSAGCAAPTSLRRRRPFLDTYAGTLTRVCSCGISPFRWAQRLASVRLVTSSLR